MKQSRVLLGVLVFFCAAALFLGCSNDPEAPNYGGEEKDLPTVSLSAADGTKYYSLSTGLEVTGADIKSDKWDIAFKRTRLILTNSGDTATALESGGKGGVWYANKTSLNEVTQSDMVDPVTDTGYEILAGYHTDQTRYYTVQMGATPTTNELTLNIMSYVGYYNEDETDAGTSAKPFMGETASSMPYLYNKKEYYKAGTMGSYSTKDPAPVYIIRHGDGEHYSKIQIEYEYLAAVTGDNPTPAKDAFAVTYQNF